MLKNPMIMCFREALDDMDSYDCIKDISMEFGDNPVDHMMSSMSEAEITEDLFPTELNSQYEDLLQ